MKLYKIIYIICLLIISCSSEYGDKEFDDLVIKYKVSKVTFIRNNDGAIDITINGGTKPFTYIWSNEETCEDLNNLYEGIYTITVTDSIGETSTKSIEVCKIGPLICEKGTCVIKVDEFQNKSYISKANSNISLITNYKYKIHFPRFLPY